MKRILTTVVLIIFWAVYPAAHAEESGSGHYMPGAMASFIDALPGRQALGYVNGFTYYRGTAGLTRPLLFGGEIVADVHGTVYADTSILLYQTDWRILGGQYAAGVAIPYMWMEVKGQVQGPLGNTFTVRDTANDIGDLLVLPFMLGWTNGDLKLGGQFGFYAPTGDYKVGQLANTGRNYWTFEPGLNASWLSSKIGLELSVFAGYDINTKNDLSDYDSGDQFHLDVTVAQHLPLVGGIAGVGANAFYYQQVTGDSGSGAQLGEFKGRTVGVGPVISYATKLGGKTDFVVEAKWMPELETENRLKGDIVWVKIALLF